MARGRLKKMFVTPAAGSYFFSVPALAFARIVSIWRGNRVHYFFEGGASAVNTRVRYLSSEGKLVFDHTIPFTGTERVFIIYKDPLL